MVHLEALKAGLTGIRRSEAPRPATVRLLRMAIGLSSFVIAIGAIYYAVIATQALFGGLSIWVIMAGALLLYLVLLSVAARQPDLALDDPNAPVTETPKLVPTLLTGLHFLLPIYILIWCLMVAHLSPGLSAYWATLAMIFIVLTQRPVVALFRRGGDMVAEAWRGAGELREGLITGSRNMIGIALATAAAGIIVGTVTLTGIGQVMTQFVELLSGGNLLLMLVLVAVISLILGMGLPTTANYIVVSTLMAPVVVALGAQSGLVVPLIAVHMFVFYFGLAADVTPPVGLASFAAAAIAREDPIKTGVQAFIYESRTLVLPFMFIFNTKLLLIGIEGPLDLFLTVLTGLAAGLLFTAAMQGYFYTRSRWWESVALLLVAFTLFRPGFWLDRVEPPFEPVAPAAVIEHASEAPAGETMRVVVRGPDFTTGADRSLTVLVPLGDPGDGSARLSRAGLVPAVEGDRAIVEEPMAGTAFFEPFKVFDFYGDENVRIERIEVPNERWPRELFWLPALLLLGLIVWLQWRRAGGTRETEPAPAPASG